MRGDWQSPVLVPALAACLLLLSAMVGLCLEYLREPPQLVEAAPPKPLLQVGGVITGQECFWHDQLPFLEMLAAKAQCEEDRTR